MLLKNTPNFQLELKNLYRDASCIIRMYNDLPSKRSQKSIALLHSSGLQRAEESNLVCYDTATKQNLPALIFAASCFSYINLYASSGQRTISLYRLTHDINSPGVVFKVPESAVGILSIEQQVS